MPRGIDQDQLDRLFTVALETAIALIEKSGDFFPLVFELREDGDAHAVAVLEQESRASANDVIAGFEDALCPRAVAGDMLACALVWHRRAPENADEPDRAVIVRLCAANYSQDITVPFQLETSGLVRRTREVSLEAFTSEPVPNRVFR